MVSRDLKIFNVATSSMQTMLILCLSTQISARERLMIRQQTKVGAISHIIILTMHIIIATRLL